MPRFVDPLTVYILLMSRMTGTPLDGRRNAIFVTYTKHSVNRHINYSTLL